MIEGVVVDCLKAKWKSFIRESFFRQFFAFTLYFILALFCFLSRDNVGQQIPCHQLNIKYNLSSDSSFYVPVTPAIDDKYGGVKDDKITSVALSPLSPPPRKPKKLIKYCQIPHPLIDHCIHSRTDTYLRISRIIGEIATLLWSDIYLLLAANEARHLGYKLFKETMVEIINNVLYYFYNRYFFYE